MKKILFGTANESKLARLQAVMSNQPVEVVGLRDLNVSVSVEESGTTPVENAEIKARAYHEATGLPTFSIDSGLYIDSLSPEKQPGVFVRRVNGRELNDDEMFEYYLNLLKEHGGDSTAYWLDAIVFITPTGKVRKKTFKEYTYLTVKPSSVRLPGHPISALQIDPDLKKYKSEITVEERGQLSNRFDRLMCEFLCEAIREI